MPAVTLQRDGEVPLGVLRHAAGGEPHRGARGQRGPGRLQHERVRGGRGWFHCQRACGTAEPRLPGFSYEREVITRPF